MSARLHVGFQGRPHVIELEGRTVTAGMALVEALKREGLPTDTSGWTVTHRGRRLTLFDAVLHGWTLEVRASGD